MAFFFSFFSFEIILRVGCFDAHLLFKEKIETIVLLTNFKSNAMTNFIIKTHRKDTIYTKPHLFILNKGMNSGKPQKEQFANSFVLI
jgi:hypothetical protein